MTKETESARARYARLAAERAKAAEREAAIREEALAELRAEIAALGFTAADIFPPAKAARKSSGKSDKPAMYRDNSTGETWTGFGKKPTWYKTKEAAGEDMQAYRV